MPSAGLSSSLCNSGSSLVVSGQGSDTVWVLCVEVQTDRRFIICFSPVPTPTSLCRISLLRFWGGGVLNNTQSSCRVSHLFTGFTCQQGIMSDPCCALSTGLGRTLEGQTQVLALGVTATVLSPQPQVQTRGVPRSPTMMTSSCHTDFMAGPELTAFLLTQDFCSCCCPAHVPLRAWRCPQRSPSGMRWGAGLQLQPWWVLTAVSHSSCLLPSGCLSEVLPHSVKRFCSVRL